MYSIYSAMYGCATRNRQLQNSVENAAQRFKATIQTAGGKTFFILGLITSAGLIGVGCFSGIGGVVGTYCFIGGGAGLFVFDMTVLAVQSCRNASRFQAYIREQSQPQDLPAQYANEEREQLQDQIAEISRQLQYTVAKLEEAQGQESKVLALKVQLRLRKVEIEQLQTQLENQSVQFKQEKLEIKGLIEKMEREIFESKKVEIKIQDLEKENERHRTHPQPSDRSFADLTSRGIEESPLNALLVELEESLNFEAEEEELPLVRADESRLNALLAKSEEESGFVPKEVVVRPPPSSPNFEEQEGVVGFDFFQGTQSAHDHEPQKVSKPTELPPPMDDQTTLVVKLKLASHKYSLTLRELISCMQEYFRSKEEPGAVFSEGNESFFYNMDQETKEAFDHNLKGYLKKLVDYVKRAPERPVWNARIKLVIKSLKKQIETLSPQKARPQLLSEEDKIKCETEKQRQLEQAFFNATHFPMYDQRYSLQNLEENCFPNVAMANFHLKGLSTNCGIASVDSFNELNKNLKLKIQEVKNNKTEASIKELEKDCIFMKELLYAFFSSTSETLKNPKNFFNQSEKIEMKETTIDEVALDAQFESGTQVELQAKIKTIMTFEWAREYLKFEGDMTTLNLTCLDNISEDDLDDARVWGDCELLHKPKLFNLNEKLQEKYKILKSRINTDTVRKEDVTELKSICAPMIMCLKAIENSNKIDIGLFFEKKISHNVCN